MFERCRRRAKLGGCCVDTARYARVDSLKLIRDGENRGTMRTTRARQRFNRWSLAKSLLAMLFSSELQLSRRLLINAVDIVLAVYTDM